MITSIMKLFDLMDYIFMFIYLIYVSQLYYIYNYIIIPHSPYWIIDQICVDMFITSIGYLFFLLSLSLIRRLL